MESKSYLKYKDRFKIISIFNLVISVCTVIALLLFIFVQCFEVKVEDIVIYRFSIYDEVKRAVKAFSAQEKGPFTMVGITSIGALGFLLITAIYAIVEFVKNLLNLSNLERFSLLQCDAVLRLEDGDGKKRVSGNTLFLAFCITSVVQIACIILNKYIVKAFGEMEEVADLSGLSHYALMEGVSWTIIFFVIFVVSLIALSICAHKYFKDICFDIVKDNYEKKEALAVMAATSARKDTYQNEEEN